LPDDVSARAATAQAPVEVLFPDTTRQRRLNAEAVVYVLIYRQFKRAIAYMQLHGALRKSLGAKVPFNTMDTSGRRDDDLVSFAVEQAEAVLAAAKEPAIEMPEVQQPMGGAESHAHAPVPAAPPVADGAAILTVEGMYVTAGHMPYRTKDGLGKPSFCVVLRKDTGNETKYWGSDLERASREAGIIPGDTVRLAKYPQVKVRVGNRTVSKNIWTVEKVA
jgi:hypothetical protein